MSVKWEHQSTNLTVWRKQRKRILARDNYKCQIKLDGCQLTATQVDHMVPWIPGTIAHDSQLQAACAFCNSSVGSPRKRNPKVDRPAWLR